MGYCPDCIVREEKICIAREFVLQEKAGKAGLYRNTTLSVAA